MDESDPLTLLGDGQQSTLLLDCNKSSREKLWKALQIWILKPHVLDRRILSRLIFSQKVLARSEVKEDAGYLDRSIQRMLSECMAAEMSGHTITDLSQFDADAPRVLLLLSKVLPRQTEHMRACYELIIIDFKLTEVFFIRLVSSTTTPAAPGYPDDINQSWSYKLSFNPREQQLKLSLSPFYEICHPVTALPVLTPPTQKWLFDTLLPKLVKWTNEVDPETQISARRSIISIQQYSSVREHLKMKYAQRFIQNWTENTDPQKFVFEDISIAAYLLVLWEEERQRGQIPDKQSFVDLGCGNGLLVHILNSEGHPGKGIDLRKRRIWDTYGPKTHLEEHAIDPGDLGNLQGYDWLIGNHSDELTPWIPVMAFRSSENTRYFVLPCCFYDFDRKYMKNDSKVTQYRSYLNFVLEVGNTCGYNVQEDSMRIPSTKRICHVGFKTKDLPDNRNEREEAIQDYIAERCLLTAMESTAIHTDQDISAASSEMLARHSGTNFEPRQRVEPVRNCSRLDESLKKMIIARVFKAVMDAGKTDHVQEAKRLKTETRWQRGGIITISEAAGLFDKETLGRLKSECGGLKTLLKNFYPVFLLKGDGIQLRDWANLETSQLQGNTKNRAKEQAKREERFKTKLCWFYLHHLDGCPRLITNCPFAHGEEDLRKPL